MLLRARIVYPVSRPPIDDGAVIVRDGKIQAVGRFHDLSADDNNQTDLGEVVLMPGLINAHCHLDYTGMAGMIPPRNNFVEWIEAIVAIKANWDYSDYAKSWVTGANQLLATGTTTVADMEAVPELIPEVWESTPLRIHTFLELISVTRKGPPEDLVNEAVARLQSHPNPRGGLALSPHALYSTYDSLLTSARHHDLTRDWRLSIHVAESAPEDEMFRQSKGAMARWLKRNHRDMSDCTGRSPVRMLHKLGLLDERLLAVHCNYLDDEDIRLLGENRVHVIHCPGSHEYFGHENFKAEKLKNAGANLCLGTDSLATMRMNGSTKPKLDLFAEMRRFASMQPAFTPEEVLQMATTNAAKALNRKGQLGELSTGAAADMIAIDSAPTSEAIIHAPPPIRSMIAGAWN